MGWIQSFGIQTSPPLRVLLILDNQQIRMNNATIIAILVMILDFHHPILGPFWAEAKSVRSAAEHAHRRERF